jgi:hypothetical protein
MRRNNMQVALSEKVRKTLLLAYPHCDVHAQTFQQIRSNSSRFAQTLACPLPIFFVKTRNYLL